GCSGGYTTAHSLHSRLRSALLAYRAKHSKGFETLGRSNGKDCGTQKAGRGTERSMAWRREIKDERVGKKGRRSSQALSQPGPSQRRCHRGYPGLESGKTSSTNRSADRRHARIFRSRSDREAGIDGRSDRSISPNTRSSCEN